MEQALGDRFSTAGTRGTGLGVVNRLMDELDIASQRVAARRSYVADGSASHPQRSAVPLGLWCGDAPPNPWARSTATPSLFFNGPRARWWASLTAWATGNSPIAPRRLRDNTWRTISTCRWIKFFAAWAALPATRGVVMALARFDWGQGR